MVNFLTTLEKKRGQGTWWIRIVVSCSGAVDLVSVFQIPGPPLVLGNEGEVRSFSKKRMNTADLGWRKL